MSNILQDIAYKLEPLSRGLVEPTQNGTYYSFVSRASRSKIVSVLRQYGEEVTSRSFEDELCEVITASVLDETDDGAVLNAHISVLYGQELSIVSMMAEYDRSFYDEDEED